MFVVINRCWLNLKRKAFVGRNVTVGRDFHIGLFSYIGASDQLEIGNDTYIGKFCSIQCNGRIGNGVLIANNVGIVGRRDHDIRQVGVPIRRANWVGDSTYLSRDPKNRIEISHDVWIGFGAVILSGITVGRGAIVASGSCVSSDVEPYSIVAGNPAVSIGRRFSADEIIRHELGLSY